MCKSICFMSKSDIHFHNKSGINGDRMDKPHEQDLPSVPEIQYRNQKEEPDTGMQNHSYKSSTSRSSSEIDLQEDTTSRRRSSIESLTSNQRELSSAFEVRRASQAPVSSDEHKFREGIKDHLPSTRRASTKSISFNKHLTAVALPLTNRRASQPILPLNQQMFEPNFEEFPTPNNLSAWQTQPPANNTNPVLASQISTHEPGLRKSSITGSEKNENLWGRRKISVHNLMDFSLMIANIAQLRAVLTTEGNQYKNFILASIILSMSFQIIFAVCMIRRQNLNQQINKAFNDEQISEKKSERIRKRRRYKKILDEIGNYLVLFILIANGLITGFGFV